MPEQILYAEIFDHTLLIHTDKRIISSRQSLKELCKTLEGKDFYRIHKSYGVNLNAVKRISKNGVELFDGTTLPVRKGEVKALKFILKTKIFSLLFRENMLK